MLARGTLLRTSGCALLHALFIVAFMSSNFTNRLHETMELKPAFLSIGHGGGCGMPVDAWTVVRRSETVLLLSIVEVPDWSLF